MLTIIEVSDIIHRRTRYSLTKNNVALIYVKFNMDKTHAHIYFILNTDLKANECTAMELRFERMFADKCDVYSVTVLNKTNHFTKDASTYLLWTKRAGFIAEPETDNIAK